MRGKLRQLVAGLYKEHHYLYDYLDPIEQDRFNLVLKGRDVDARSDILKELSQYLRIYYNRKCIVLIDEYDHPLDVAFHNGFYDGARDMFATLFGALLKVSIL